MLAKFFYSILIHPYVLLPLMGVAALTTVLVVRSRRKHSKRIYQKKLHKKLNKVKKAQRTYERRLESTRVEKFERKHDRAVKKLRKAIRKVIKNNRKIVIKDPVLIKTGNINRSNQEPLTFMELFNEEVNDHNYSAKKLVSVNTAKNKKGKYVESRSFTPRELGEIYAPRTSQNVASRALTEDEMRKLGGSVNSKTTAKSQQKATVSNVNEDDIFAF